MSDDEVEDPGNQEEKPPAEDSEDEADYYRQAVGEEPDEGIVSYPIFPKLYCYNLQWW